MLWKKLTVLLATALMLAMVLVSSGMASAAECGVSCGGGPFTGAEHASPSAAFGIATARVNSIKHALP